MSDIPEIRINFGYLLYGAESKVLAEKYGHKLPSEEQFEEWTENYRKEWKKYEGKIIPAMVKALGVKFYMKVIDVTCAPSFIPKSDPMLMSYFYRPDEFTDVLTHELCHKLLTDNEKIQIHSSKKTLNLGELWAELFGKHEFSLLVHIPVQALMWHLYMDVLKEPSRLERDKSRSEDWGEAYTGSWEYVEKHGYKEIITKLKKSYAEMPV